jgi:hypothetical protein
VALPVSAGRKIVVATTELHPLYAISGILIVADTAIPEPGALAVLGLGLLGIGFV